MTSILDAARELGIRDAQHHGAARGGVGAQLVGDQSSRDTALGFQQRPKESDGCSPIPVRWHEAVQDVTVLVDRAPQILVATLDRDEHLVEMPGVSQPTAAAPQPPRVDRTEPLAPRPNRLVGDHHASLREEIFGIAETKTEPVSRPEELHPQPLVERYVNLSAHTAPIRRTHLSSRSACLEMTNGFAFIRISSWRAQLDTDKTARRRPFAPSP